LNATHEVSFLAGQRPSLERSERKIQQYLPINPEAILRGNPYSAELLNFLNADDLFIDRGPLFDKYLTLTRVEEAANSLGLRMKSQHTVIEKWPMRLNEHPTQHEFEMLYWSGHVGSERYVEWCQTR
jgi:hypothetical protein